MTRDEEIGRAAKDAARPMSMCVNEDHRWQMIGLAAVSRAREIDTCETCDRCKVATTGEDAGEMVCDYFGVPVVVILGIGCNRHQPKEA